MEILADSTAPAQITADALIVGIYQAADWSNASAGLLAAPLDIAAGGALARVFARGEIAGKLNETLALHDLPGVKAPVVALVGLGPREKFGRGPALQSACAAARLLSGKRRGSIAVAGGEAWEPAWIDAALCGAQMGCVGQDLYRTEKNRHPFARITWCGQADLTAAQALGESVNLTRRLVNASPQEIYPESFAQEARTAAAQYGLECDVWDETRLIRERCGSLLAVARGAARAPRLVIVRYRGASDGPILGLVGKGVTFDSGGLSLKPSESMTTMKCDMAGAATVLGAICAIARLKLPCRVTALMGLVENMPDGRAMKLGEILTARSGKTIEVLNTDAEGRLVLADVLNVALQEEVHSIIDLATLTGACVVALGTDVNGLMSNSQPWCDTVLRAAQLCGEPAWQLPMFPEYRDHIASEVADIKNIGDGRWGGAISAAKFLEEFVDGRPWVHCDIAGPAFRDKPKPFADAGATGTLLRTLVEVAAQWPQNQPL